MATFDIQMKQRDNNGVNNNMYPNTKAANVSIATNNPALPTNSSTVEDVVAELGDLAFEDSIVIPDASTSTAGVVQLSNTTNDTATESTAATTKALGEVNRDTVHKSGEESINGLKTFNAPIVVNGDLKISSTYDSTADVKTVTFQFLDEEEEETPEQNGAGGAQ